MKLDEFLARLDDVEQSGDGYLATCPGHRDSKPSLRVAVSAKGLVLVKCRAGCAIAAVLAPLGLALADLARMEGSDAPGPRAVSTDAPAGPADVAALAVRLDGWALPIQDAARDGYPDDATTYAAERFGLTMDAALRLGLGNSDGALPGGPRLVVPFRDADGVARGFQARALDPNAAVRWYGPKSPDGAAWAKVGFFPGGSGWDEVLVCEGPGDALTACALGYDSIAVRGAALASNPAVVDSIKALVGDRAAVIAGDGDPAGRAFSATLARALAEAGVRARILDVPDGLDLTDWRAQDPARFSTAAVRAVMQAAEVTGATAALRSRDEGAYPLTDLGNARFARDFVAAQGSGVRYSPEAGFFLLDGGVWRPDRLDRARAYIQEAADLIAQIADSLAAGAGNDTNLARDARRWQGWSRHSQSSRGIDAALRELQALPDVAADVNDFDRHPDLLACRNGVINLRTGTLQPHDARLLLTRRVDLDYDPAAAAPRWERFLGEVFPANPALPHYIRRLLGYGITGRTDEQCFAVLWGTGANGKSVFTDTLTEVFRELTVTTPFSTFEEKPSGGIPNDIAALKGARLVMASEGEAGKRMAEALLKRITGRDLISARFMRREFFEFKPTFLLLLATNSRPNFHGQDEGLWRRVKMIPWERYFAPEERDHRLGADLLKEAPGIFAWAVRGAGEWYANGLGDPDVIRLSTKEYRDSSDVLQGFYPGQFVADDVDGRGLPAPKLFAEFQAWADENNMLDLKRWSSRAFYSALEERGLSRKRGTGGQFFVRGIRRARQTDAVPDHAEPERAAGDLQADSLPETRTAASHPSSGPSLDDVF